MSFHEGVRLFNDARFWDAHEVWESLWLQAPEPDRRFLQGLIQLAAAYHHLQRGTYRGGVRLFASAAAKLSAFPEGYRGLMRDEAMHAGELHRERAARGEKIAPDEYPKLRYN
jgi:uncharacterized protein